VVRPAAQRPVRLTTALRHLGLALGGEARARLGATLHMSTSPDTVLRLLQQLPQPMMLTPMILGVDAWAMRRGHTSGTLVVDLEHHRPLDLLPDRTADPLTAWLRAHPGGIILRRDDDGQDHPKRVDEEMALATFDVFVGSNAPDPPFSVVCTDWLVMGPARGWRRLPAAARTSPLRRSCSRCQVPSCRQRQKSWSTIC
jgi:hypothetical protein